jgi:hypothetical protein
MAKEHLQYLTLFTGFASAGLWFWAARIQLSKRPFTDRRLDDDLSDIADPINTQGRLNGWAAAMSAIAVGTQSLSFFLFG